MLRVLFKDLSLEYIFGQVRTLNLVEIALT